MISDEQLKTALKEQQKWGGRLGKILVELGFVTETSLAAVLAQQIELPVIDLDVVALDIRATQLVRLDLCERYGVFPTSVDDQTNVLCIATADPINLDHLRAIEFATQMRVSPLVATESAIARAIRRFYFGEVEVTPQAEVAGTTFDLREMLAEKPAPSAPQQLPLKAQPDETFSEIAALAAKIKALEELNAAHVKALRSLLEVLIEAGLVSREEYLQKLHAAV